MTTIATATTTFTSWDEEPSWEGDPPLPRLAQATVAFSYSGQTEGEGDCRYVLFYDAEGTGTGVGLEHLTATVDGQTAEVVLRHDVTFGADGVQVEVATIAGTGTGAFEDRAARGRYAASHGDDGWTWSLETVES